MLTGVSTARDVILADPAERPAFLHTDLRGLIEAHPEPVSDGDWWRVGQESARVSGDRLELAGTGALEQPATVTLDAYRALAAAAWASADAASGTQAGAPALSVPEITVAA